MVTVYFNDSINWNTAAREEQRMTEVSVTKLHWEHCMRWNGEDEFVARAKVAERILGMAAHAIIEYTVSGAVRC